VALLAELARNYVELRSAQAELAVAEERLDAHSELARLTTLRFEAGEANRLETNQAESQRATAAAARDGWSAQAASAAYRIAVLVGEPLDTVIPALREPAPLPEPPSAIVSGVRSELLQRRPDVRRAERELAAATADVGVATADLFPRFSLLGSLGQQARDAADLLSGGSTRLSIGPSFSWPVFSGGRIRAQIRAADARTEVAAARYDRAVLGALADSEAAANRFANASSAAEEAERALDRETAAYRLARLRFEEGEDDRLALTRSGLRLLDARSREREAKEALSSAAISLYKALGGGWNGE
jgi:NodT family efflux transporter outer membrane factor (OMF) lipoprotein